MRYDSRQCRLLLEVAYGAVARGVYHGLPAAIDPSRYHAPLRMLRASFVTLKLDERLRGCIGSLEAVRPLVEDVNANAFAAAFRDHRFPPVSAPELDRLTISIAILSEPEAMAVDGEQDLLARLRPGIDGLILQEGRRRGTFLPTVWESLPEPGAFLRQLKLKTGFDANYWSAGVKVWRYSVESVG